MERLLTTEELARATGVPVRTIRLYRQMGAIAPRKLPGMGNRVFYGEGDVRRVLAMRAFQGRLRDRAQAEVLEYRVGSERRVSEVVERALVDGSIVMVLKDGTVVIRKPLPEGRK